ncbi:hypothetical protein EDB19DRAFT_591724 [Suillus lakei]|nr:hypothetical protein EDB19DRAFT_591724 [Suillus lakei]
MSRSSTHSSLPIELSRIIEPRRVSCAGRICSCSFAIQLHSNRWQPSWCFCARRQRSRLETCTGFHIFQLLGLRDSCGGWRPIQFIPGLPPEFVAPAISHPSFTALHFTGSIFVF